MAKQRHNLHSFTLWPRASQIVTQVSSGRKSQYVSKAIIWFAEPQEVISEKEYTEDELKKNESFISKMLKLFAK